MLGLVIVPALVFYTTCSGPVCGFLMASYMEAQRAGVDPGSALGCMCIFFITLAFIELGAGVAAAECHLSAGDP